LPKILAGPSGVLCQLVRYPAAEHRNRRADEAKS
jgi:hypothetical protein